MEVRSLLEAALRAAGSREDLASLIDATLLSPSASVEEVRRLVEEAADEGYACVVTTPLHLREVASEAGRLGVRLCSVIGFPLGSHPLDAKLAEAKEALESGAEELDVVPALWKDADYVESEVARIVELARSYGAKVKVILEAPLQGDEKLRRLVEASRRAGAWMVKTSTGVYSKGGDPLTVSRLAALAKPAGLGVKASGGIRTALDALLAIGAGADRVGTSSARKVLDTLGGLA